jgi:hypothetical protein
MEMMISVQCQGDGSAMYRTLMRRVQLPTVAMVAAVAILVAACNGEAETPTQPTAATTPTTVTTTSTAPPTTAPAATAPATAQDLVLTFDGERCTYEGPSEGVITEPLNLTLINNSDVFTFGGVAWVQPDLLEELMPTVGTDFPFSEEGAIGVVESLWAFFVEAASRSEASINAFAATPGTYVLECITTEGATRTHYWRPAVIELSP